MICTSDSMNLIITFITGCSPTEVFEKVFEDCGGIMGVE